MSRRTPAPPRRWVNLTHAHIRTMLRQLDSLQTALEYGGEEFRRTHPAAASGTTKEKTR